MSEIITNLRFTKIQEFRAAQAIAEVATIVVPPRVESSFKHLEQYFAFNWTARRAKHHTDVLIDHELPRVCVGAVERPLLFPHAIVTRLAQPMYWAPSKRRRVVFLGKMTEQRRLFIGAFDAHLRAVDSTMPFYSLATERGRRFPGKVWDAEYFQSMGRAQFVLCPDGDFVWTYRFFEACLVGAIPVIQNVCSLYDGFHVARAGATAPLKYNAQKARENAQRAMLMLTVPKRELAYALGSVFP